MAHSPASSSRPPRRGRLFRRLLMLGVILVVVLLVVVALAPTIAGPLVRPMVQDAVNSKIKGEATVSSLGLAWFGGQRAELTLTDPEGGTVADVSVRVDRGLLGLVFGSRDLGVVFVKGSATIVRDADGTTNLQRAIEPRVASTPDASSSTGEPVTLPSSLATSIVFDGLEVVYQDAALAAQTGGKIGALRLGSLTGSADFSVGKPVKVAIKGPIATGADIASLAESGSLDLQLTLENLTDAAGALTIDKVVADLTLALTAPVVDALIEARYSDGVLERTGATRVLIDTTALADLVPKVAEALAAQPGVTLGDLPDISLVVDRLTLPLDGGIEAISAAVTLETTRATGTVELPTGDTVRTAAFAIEPLKLVVDVPSLGETVTLTGGTRATIDGDSAGDVSVDLAVGGLLDASGALRSGIPEQIEGGLHVEGFSTPILQPFVAALGSMLPEGLRLDLPGDIGPRVDLTLKATSHTDGSGAYDIDLALNAANAELDAAIVVQGQQITTRGEGVRGKFATVAPIIDRFAAAYGVRVSRGAEVTFSVSDLAVDLAKVRTADGLDLRGVRAKADVSIVDAVGKMQFAGDDTLRDYRLERLSFGIATDDLAKDITVVGDMSGRLNGKPLGSAKINMTLAGLLDATGAPKVGSVPTLRGEVRVEKLAMDTIDAVFGPLYRESGLVLVRDVGPQGDVVILAASNPGSGANATNLDLTFRSRSIDITAPLVVQPDRLRSRGPVTLVDRTAGKTIATFLGDAGPVLVQPEGSLRLVIAGLDVPLGADGVRPDQVSAKITATLTEFVADVGLLLENGGVGQRLRIDAPEVVVSMIAVAGAPPHVSIDSQLSHADGPFTVVGALTLHGLFLDAPADPADPMSVLAPLKVVPTSTLKAEGIPATLARLVPRGMIEIGGKPLDVVLLWRDTLGRTFDVSLTTRESDKRRDTAVYTVELVGGPTRAKLSGRLRPNFVSLDRGTGNIGVTPRVASHLAKVMAADAPVIPALKGLASVGFVVNKPLELRLGEGFVPDFASGGVFDATVSLDAAFAAITLPAADAADGGAAAEPMTIPPVTIKGLKVAIVAPLAAMTEAGGRATVALTGAVLAADGSSLTGLRGSASAQMKNAKPVGETPVRLTLSKVNAKWIDTLLAKPALVAGSVGDRFDVTITAEPQRLLARATEGTPLTLNIVGPRFSTEEPIGVVFAPKAVYLRGEVKASWQMGPRWANLYFLGARPGSPPPAFKFAKQTRVHLDIKRLALAYGDGAAPLKPGVFLANLTATVPELAATLSDGRAMQVGGLEVRIGRGPTPDQIGLAITVPRLKVGDEPEMKPKRSKLTGTLASFTDAEGNLTPKTARLTLEGGFAPIPTAVLDAFAKQDGLLVDVLGAVVDFEIHAQEFGMNGGRLVVSAVAPFAKAEIRGQVRDGLFVVDKSSVVEATRITPAATKRLQKALPMLASLEKTGDDRPARVIFETPIEVPMDGNFDRLNGKLTIDIGTARFGTADLFQKVLAAAQQKTAGEVGRRLPPLKITMVDGLVSYEPYPLPMGEFKIETQGFINLGSKARRIRGGGGSMLPAGELEVLTFIPAGAFAAEAIPGLANIPLPIVGNLARLPIRTSGLIAKPKNDIAIDLVGENAIDTLLSPENLLDNLLGGGEKKK